MFKKSLKNTLHLLVTQYCNEFYLQQCPQHTNLVASWPPFPVVTSKPKDDSPLSILAKTQIKTQKAVS